MTFDLKNITGWIPGIIRKNFWRKMAALISAVLVWYNVSSRIGSEKTVENVKVKLTLPPALVLSDESGPQMVSLVASGSQRILNMLTANSFKISVAVNEKNYVPGDFYTVYITPDDVSSPLGVRVKEVRPNHFTIMLDKIVTKTVTVEARFSGAPPPGYAPGRVLLNPETVKVSGPRGIVGGIDKIQTKAIKLDSTTEESFDYLAPIEEAQPGVKVAPQRVLAQVEIVKQYDAKTFRALPIRVLEGVGGEGGMTMTPLSNPNVDIEVSGPKNNLELLRPEQIKPYVDISPFDEPGVYNVDVSCWMDESKLKIESIIPTQVKISLSLRKSAAKD